MLDQIKITIPLKLFVELSINSFEGFIEVQHKDLIVELLAQDRQEQFIHVERVDTEEVKQLLCMRYELLSKPPFWLVWRKEDWTISIDKRSKDYARSQKEREEWAKRKRNIERLKRSIIKITGMDADQAEMMSHNIIDKKPQSAKAFGVELEK